ncbi:hypothetical protein DYB32_001969 [Aphanomyces invadans]|uniref:Uncharacterized protein n=1 Tax=Aphanomyces invadans TaxID=157072 RepID=A0A418B4T0_9STRA|nr:hypothetical protein DYB32_001969 [Aphanomyces invadans]
MTHTLAAPYVAATRITHVDLPDLAQAIFTCSKLAWCIWSKESSGGDDLWPIQKEIPAFITYPQGGGDPCELDVQLATLATALEKQHATFGAVATHYGRESSKAFQQLKALVTDKMVLQRRIRQLYHPLVAALTHRMSVASNQVDVMSQLVDLPQAEIATSHGNAKLCSCRIHLVANQIVYTVDSTYTRVHPYTDELMAELATESAAEMKVHMELTVATMQLTDTLSGDGVGIEFLD